MFGMLKSMFRLALLDDKEKLERKQVSFGGLGEILSVLMEWTSGAAKQPITRLFGVQSKSMGDSGDGDNRNYNNRIRGEQETKYRKCLSQIDEVLIRSTLGEMPDDSKFEFNPLAIPTEDDVKNRNLAEAQTDEIRLQQGVVSKVMVARKLKEAGQYGIDDQFIARLEADERAEQDGDRIFRLRAAEETDPGGIGVQETGQTDNDQQ